MWPDMFRRIAQGTFRVKEITWVKTRDHMAATDTRVGQWQRVCRQEKGCYVAD